MPVAGCRLPDLAPVCPVTAPLGARRRLLCCGHESRTARGRAGNPHRARVAPDPQAHDRDRRPAEPWCGTLVDTGEHTLTGGRLRRVQQYLPADEPFCFTYGDGLADLDMGA